MSHNDAEILAVIIALLFAGVAGYCAYIRNIPAALLAVFLGVLAVAGILIAAD